VRRMAGTHRVLWAQREVAMVARAGADSQRAQPVDATTTLSQYVGMRLVSQ